MTRDIFDHLKQHYESIARELHSQAHQARLLTNPTGVGSEREEVYRAFLERHLPKMCDVFRGGFIFDLSGNSSDQIDVIVTSGNTPRFRMSGGNRYIAPLEGTIAVAEIKSRLDKSTLLDALSNCASIPSMPDPEGIVPPYLRVDSWNWEDTPFKIVFAYNGIDASTVCQYIKSFYDKNQHISLTRRPNIIHVLGKYMITRKTPGMTVINPDGQPDISQPDVGQYHPFLAGPDVSALGWTLNEIQSKASMANMLLFKYVDWHNKIMTRIQRD